MKNQFFRTAFLKASTLVGQPGRLMTLVAQLFNKLDRTHFTSALWREQFLLLGRLVKAYATGNYRTIPLKSFLTIVAALIYFINPFDLIPDTILVLGLTDDLAILGWVFKIMSQELNDFKHWEKENVFSQTSI